MTTTEALDTLPEPIPAFLSEPLGLPATDSELIKLLAPLVDPDEQEDWTAQALCNQIDPDLWFPEKGGSVREAKEVCMRCPVRDECLEYALANDERFGIWGGYSERERRKMVGPKRRPRAVA